MLGVGVVQTDVEKIIFPVLVGWKRMLNLDFVRKTPNQTLSLKAQD